MTACVGERVAFPAQGGTGAGCIGKYAARSANGDLRQRLPEKGHVLAPWVRCGFKNGQGRIISVGNMSSPEINNTAVIKSFEFGASDGLHCKVVIHDSSGSSITTFMENLVRDITKLDPNNLNFTAQWGWAKSGCDGLLYPPASSACHYMLIESVETNFVGGKFIHEITGVDLITKSVEVAVDDIHGGDGAEVSLKEALKKLFTEPPAPYVAKIDFCRMEGGNRVSGVKFKEGEDGEGPKSRWSTNGTNKLQIAMEWLAHHVSDRDKTFVPSYNSLDSGGEVIFWEDPRPKPGESPDPHSNSIGHYIVNGAQFSPVIEFNPKIRWDFSRLMCAGGHIPDNTAEGTPGNKTVGQLCKPPAGQTASAVPDDSQRDISGKEAQKEADKAASEQARGLKLFSETIEADLVIIGDPSLPTVGEGITARNVAIAYLNPFHLMPARAQNQNPSNPECPEWLARPACNEILSNTGWFIKRISHQIKEGSYITVLGVWLPAGGIDFDPDIGAFLPSQ